jgi:uncharacterized protein YehS (DUF1456 family)
MTEKEMQKYTNDMDKRAFNEINNKFQKGSDKVVNNIIDQVVVDATERYLGAAYGGRHDDGGSSVVQEKLKSFLDGINYAKTGKSEIYSSIIEQYNKKQDAEWAEYQRLVKKFGKKEPAAFSN